MINWIYLVLISQWIWSFTSIIDKIVISKGYIKNPLVYIVLNGLSNILLIFLLPFAGFESLKFADFLIVLVSEIALIASVAAYYKAVEYDEISKVVILFEFAPIFGLILSLIFLGDFLTKNQIVGFILLLAAGIAISYKKIDRSFKLSKSFYYMLISTFLSAIGFVTAKYIFNVMNFWNAFLWLRLTGFIAIFVLHVPSIRKQFAQTVTQMEKKIKWLLSFKMVIDFCAFIFAGYGLRNGPVALVSALSSAVLPLFVFMLAILSSVYMPNVIKENIDKKSIMIKILAIALIIAGIIFINK